MPCVPSMTCTPCMRHGLMAWVCLLGWLPASGGTIHVSPHGDDAGPGSSERPLRTLAAAARLAEPGDTVRVHAGTYRERVDPPRGGESESKRITYEAAPGERVVITGSEPVKDWRKVEGDTWQVVLPNHWFGNFNPYLDRIRGDWFDPKGRVHHTGCVYVNGEWLAEAANAQEVMRPAGPAPHWFARVDGEDGNYLVNVAWFQPSGGPRVPAGEPSWRYGGRPAPCAEGGTCSGFIRLGDQLRFDAVDFGSGSDRIEFRAAAPSASSIEVRVDSAEGGLLGTCKVEPTGDWQNWRSFTAAIQPTSGRRKVFLVFTNEAFKAGSTTILAQFPGVDPNAAAVEINKRQTVFYPSRNFVNFITVRGFILENAATNWAPPSAEQTAAIGTNWSKGWVIEGNTIRFSKCSGIALGKYGDGTDNTNEAGAADPYTACVRRALDHGWDQSTVGGHLVRGNHIHHCEQAGIVGSLGCAFSRILGNEIHDIDVRQGFGGAEQAGIKFHGAIDAIIHGNHVYRCNGVAGLWLDWMAQGAVVTSNLFHDNAGGCGDVFFEMQHGPLLFANNLVLSQRRSLTFNAKGLAVCHNLIAGAIGNTRHDDRRTPFHAPHATAIAGLHDAPGGDHRIHNNLLAAPCDWSAIDNCPLACQAEGNVFTQGTQGSKFDTAALARAGFEPAIQLTEKADGWYLGLAADRRWAVDQKRQLVTSARLGKATVPGLPYEHPDGTPVRIDTDYFGLRRDPGNPFPGPIEVTRDGRQEYKVWPVGGAAAPAPEPPTQ